MTAELEEVVVDADPIDLQLFRPYSCQLFFQGIARRDVCLLQALRCLNTASYADRWRWIAIVSALRPMIEIALERMEAGVKHKLRKSEVN